MRALKQYPELADEAMRVIEASGVDLSDLDAYESLEDYAFNVFENLEGSNVEAQVERVFTEFSNLYEAGCKADSEEMRVFLSNTARKWTRVQSDAETLFARRFMEHLLEHPFMKVFVECGFGNGASSYLVEALQNATGHFNEFATDSEIQLATEERS